MELLVGKSLLLIIVIYGTVLMLASPAAAQQLADLKDLQIVINIPSFTLELYADGNLVKRYPVAVGKPSEPTPVGDFFIVAKEVNPWWYPVKGKAVPPGPDNPLGYRWMTFYDVYGIHGTNAPWSLGHSVSKGCVRMFEEDVEELFEIVSIGTPVKITYETVRVTRNEKGAVYLTVYPDIYGYSANTVAAARQVLAAHGLGDWVDDQELQAILTGSEAKPVQIAQFIRLKANGGVLVEQGFWEKGRIFVPLSAIAQVIAEEILWEPPNPAAVVAGRKVPVVVKGGKAYLEVTQLVSLFGAGYKYDREQQTVELFFTQVLYNGQLNSSRGFYVDGALAVPLVPLLVAMGDTYVWAPGSPTVYSSGRKIPVVVIHDAPFIKLTDISRYLMAYVCYSAEAHLVAVTSATLN